MPSPTEFMLAEAALQAEFLRRKIAPPNTEDDLPEITEGYLSELFSDENANLKKVTPIKSTFLTRMREEEMAKTPHITNVYIGTNGVRQEEEVEEEEGEKVAAETPSITLPVVDEGLKALKISYEQRMKSVSQAVRRYGILDGSDFWPIATYEDHVIASDWYTGKFHLFDYALVNDEVILDRPLAVADSTVDVSEAAKSAPFQLLRQRDGKFRWMTVSSNTYKDSYKENFSKDSLEEAVEAMQRSGDYGELRLEHVLTSRVGSCDFSKVLGNFLVESGTFDSTPYAKRVIESLQGDKEDKWKVSIGFFYNPEYLVDGEYKSHVRIHERSITQIPANTVTAISLAELGGSMENADRKARLAALVGDEFAEDMIRKEIEAATTAALGRKDAADGFTASGVRKDEEVEEDDEKKEEEIVVVDPSDGTEYRAVREEVVEQLQSGIRRTELKSIIAEVIGEQMTALRADVLKEVKKETNSELPRAVKTRFTLQGRVAETEAEKKEATEVVAAAKGNTREDFWKGVTGGHPSN